MISMDKKYRYRHGGEARILAVDAPANQPVISMSMSGPDKGSIYRHRADGRFSSSGVESPRDLIEVKPDVVKYANVYSGSLAAPHGIGPSYDSLQTANLMQQPGRCGVVKITFSDGKAPQFDRFVGQQFST